MVHNDTVPPPKIFTRDYILGFLALLTFLIVNSALFPVFPIFLNGLGSSEREIGILIGIFGASSLFSRFLVGGALTKYSERLIMICGTSLFALTLAACIVLKAFWPLFAVRILQGIAIACLDTAALALVVRVAPQAYQGQAISYFMLAPTISLALATSPGVYLISNFGSTVFFAACVGCSLMALAFSYRLTNPGGRGQIKSDENGKGGYIDLKMMRPAIVGFFHNFVWGSLTAFVPLHAIRSGIKNPGHFFLAISLMVLISRIFGSKIVDAYSKRKIIVVSITISMAAVILVSFSSTATVLFLAGLLWGIAGAFIFPASIAFAIDYTGSSSGPSIGTFRALMDLGLTIGPMVMGLIVPVMGYRVMFLSLLFICLINLSYFYFCLRKTKRGM